MSIRQTVYTYFKSFSRQGQSARATTNEGVKSLSDGTVQHIGRDTRTHRLTSILSRQIVDAQFRLASIECPEERFAQIRLIDDLMRRRNREIRSPLQYG